MRRSTTSITECSLASCGAAAGCGMWKKKQSAKFKPWERYRTTILAPSISFLCKILTWCCLIPRNNSDWIRSNSATIALRQQQDNRRTSRSLCTSSQWPRANLLRCVNLSFFRSENTPGIMLRQLNRCTCYWHAHVGWWENQRWQKV